MCFRRQTGVQGGDPVSDSCEEHLTHLEMATGPAAHSKDGDILPYNFSLENAEQNRDRHHISRLS